MVPPYRRPLAANSAWLISVGNLANCESAATITRGGGSASPAASRCHNRMMTVDPSPPPSRARPRGGRLALAALVLAALALAAGVTLLPRLGQDEQPGSDRPTATDDSSVFNGDFETGDLTQWDEDRTQRVSDDRLRVVTDPVRQGRYALRAEVRQGDDPIDSGDDRAEVLRKDEQDPEGSVRWYAWSTMLPRDYPIDESWQVFLQFKQDGEGSPPVQLGAADGTVGISAYGGKFTMWETQPELGRWHDFVLGVKWSPDKSVGWLELWYDGQQVLPRTTVATMYAFDGRTLPNYVKLGYYRAREIEPPGVIYHDGFRVGATRKSVARG